MAKVLNRQRRMAVKLGELEVFAGHVERALRMGRDAFAVCMVSDAEIARMNQRFRGKHGPTDVLSFPAGEGRNGKRALPAEVKGHLGDIAISPETARRNARRYGRTLRDELRILILHGALHLLGYDHETDSGQMERREARLRRQLGIA
jgi:probable rRNA maturation factor